MDIYEIRKSNLRHLITSRGDGKKAKLAGLIETSPAYISQILSAKTKASVGARLARQIERKLQLPNGWMDAIDHPDPQQSIHADALLKDFNALPPGLQEHIARKTAELRRYSDALPEFIKSALRPPTDKEGYRAWEREMEADMHTKMNGKTKEA